MNSPERLPVAPATEAAKPPPSGSVIDDLLSSRETANRAPRPPGRAARRRGWLTERRDTEQRSLFGEILDWMLAPLLLLWPLSIGFTFVVARSLADAPFDRTLREHASIVVSQVQVVGSAVTVPDSKRLLEMLAKVDEEGFIIQVSAADGELLAGTSEFPPPALYDFPQPGVVKLRNEQHRGEEIRVAYTYVMTPDDVEGERFPVLVQVGETMDKRSALANQIIKGLIFPQFLILPLAVGLVWFGLGRGLEPLKRMQERIRERRPDDLSPIDPRGAPEEISPLVDAFNELLSRLDGSIGAQKRFIADAAHQMKTPLAGLRAQTELALREEDPEQLRRSLEQIAIGSERAAHLISQLLSLARTENLRDATRLDPLDLAPLARSAASDWVGEALRRRIDFGYEGDEAPMPIVGHPILLREMFNNLIDNALRYTPPNGAVTVRLLARGGHALFEVEDTGRGIPPSERPLVFERFYRVLGTQTDGSGLGLAIVREIAQQHNAEIDIEDGGTPQAPCGTRVTIRFPVVAF